MHCHCSECGWTEGDVKDLLEIQRGIRRGVWQLVHLLTPKQLTHAIVVWFSGGMVENNVLVLNVGQTSQASILPLLADGITPSGGVVSGVSFNFSDPSATVVMNADGLTATVTGVSDSGGIAVQGLASCTITDTNSVISQWQQAFTVQTVGIPKPLTASVAVQFSDPVDGNQAGVSAPKLSAKKPLNE